MFSVMVLELMFPIWTVWDLPVRKSRIQLQVEVFSPSRSSLVQLGAQLLRDDSVEWCAFSCRCFGVPGVTGTDEVQVR